MMYYIFLNYIVVCEINDVREYFVISDSETNISKLGDTSVRSFKDERYR